MFLSFITLIQIKNPVLEGFSTYITETVEFSLEGLGGGIIGASFAYLFFEIIWFHRFLYYTFIYNSYICNFIY